MHFVLLLKRPWGLRSVYEPSLSCGSERIVCDGETEGHSLHTCPVASNKLAHSSAPEPK